MFLLQLLLLILQLSSAINSNLKVISLCKFSSLFFKFFKFIYLFLLFIQLLFIFKNSRIIIP
nr:MAG TPA: hypothetical protein [Caudoviricetes sp.]